MGDVEKSGGCFEGGVWMLSSGSAGFVKWI